jgi:hypothetical protein
MEVDQISECAEKLSQRSGAGGNDHALALRDFLKRRKSLRKNSGFDVIVQFSRRLKKISR